MQGRSCFAVPPCLILWTAVTGLPGRLIGPAHSGDRRFRRSPRAFQPVGALSGDVLSGSFLRHDALSIIHTFALICKHFACFFPEKRAPLSECVHPTKSFPRKASHRLHAGSFDVFLRVRCASGLQRNRRFGLIHASGTRLAFFLDFAGRRQRALGQRRADQLVYEHAEEHDIADDRAVSHG